jgi:hypothetical protein
MTGGVEDPVKPVHMEMDCRGCDHHIETTIRLPTALVHGGAVRVRCSECGRPTPYRKEDSAGYDPDWFFSLGESDQVHRFTRGTDAEGDG